MGESIILKSLELHDIRFPTFLGQHGSDAMHTNPAYSAAYVILHTNSDSVNGYGFTFTIGRGNEVVLKCIEALEFLIKGQKLTAITDNFGKFWHDMTNENQLRWLGPQKGVIHMASAAIINAIWDLWARVEHKPFWKLVVDMEPEKIISLIDFSYVEDFLTPEEAITILKKNQSTKLDREQLLEEQGYPAYITSAGWLGYTDSQIKKKLRIELDKGFNDFKMKVGKDIESDENRMKLIRTVIGNDRRLMADANQIWFVNQAISNMERLAKYKPYWIEEPTSPDDILGHKAIAEAMNQLNPKILVATGEHCQNAVMFKQFLQLGAMQVCQIDSCRIGGPNEILLVLLMAAKAGVPVCPHAGGVGLCELVQHYSYIDYLIISGTMKDRMLEFADHLHDYFADPVTVNGGKYRLPKQAGFNAKFLPAAIEKYSFPDGTEWKKILGEN